MRYHGLKSLDKMGGRNNYLLDFQQFIKARTKAGALRVCRKIVAQYV